MSLDPLRLVEHVHGHLGWLAAVALAHPAIVLRNPERRANLAVALSTALVTLASAIGLWLYVSYREKLRQPIFLASPTVGYLFERKEHLAFAALALTWAAASSYAAALRAPASLRPLLGTITLRAFTLAAILALLVALLGTTVALHRSF